LTSLEALFRFLRIYSVVPQDQLRVFSSPSLEDLNEQLARENNGDGSASVTAAQFLHERGIRSTSTTQAASASSTQEHSGRSGIAIASVSAQLTQDNAERHAPDAGNGNILERRRRAIEWGAGGDHDRPYAFALPGSWPQVSAWIRLLVRVHTGELQP
jgi:hypothetical protein